MKWHYISTDAQDMRFYRELLTKYAPEYGFNIVVRFLERGARRGRRYEKEDEPS